MSGKEEEQKFTIQPHPANDNVSNTAPPEQTAGLGGAPNLAFLHDPHKGNPGPHVPSSEIAESLEKPKTREELQSLKASLNKSD